MVWNIILIYISEITYMKTYITLKGAKGEPRSRK
jgi:hypothetical protein